MCLGLCFLVVRNSSSDRLASRSGPGRGSLPDCLYHIKVNCPGNGPSFCMQSAVTFPAQHSQGSRHTQETPQEPMLGHHGETGEESNSLGAQDRDRAGSQAPRGEDQPQWVTGLPFLPPGRTPSPLAQPVTKFPTAPAPEPAFAASETALFAVA